MTSLIASLFSNGGVETRQQQVLEQLDRFTRTITKLATKNKSLTVLIIDDEDWERDAFVREMTPYNVKAFGARTVDDGLALYGRCKDEIDGVVVDLNMNGAGLFDGLRVLEALKDDGVRLIVISGAAPPRAIIDDIRRMRGTFIAKPFDPALVMRCLRYGSL